MLCTAALLLAAAPAAAQSDAGDPATAAGQGAVLVYPAAFFASANPGTALDMVQRLPGFALDIGDIDARGLAGAVGNVLVDGARPTSKGDTLYEVLQRIPAGSVERIELIRGGTPGIDMHGRAVVADVILKRTPKTEIVVESNAYVYDDFGLGPSLKASYTRRAGDRTTEASVFATTDRSGYAAQGTRIRSDADGAPLQAARLDQHDRYQDYDARGAIQRPFRGGKLHANAVLDDTRSGDGVTTSILSGPGDDERVEEGVRYPNGEIGFTWTGTPGPRTTLELTGLQRLNRLTYRGMSTSAGTDTLFASAATGSESVLRLTDTVRPSGKWTFQGGGEIAYNLLDTTSAYAEDGVPVALPDAAVRVSELRGEAFAQATWQPSGLLTVDGTLRGELSRIAETGDTRRARTFAYPKPKLQVTWLPGTGHQLRLRLEQDVAQLDFGDFAASTNLALGTVAGGNADLRPQRSDVIEAAYERRFWKKGAVSLTLRHSAVSDVVDILPLAGGIDATGNIGRGRSDLAQLSLTLPFDRLGVKNALLKLDGSAVRSRVTDPLTGMRRSFAFQPPYDCSVSFTHDLKGGRFSYGFEHACNVDRYRRYLTAELRTERVPPAASVYGQWKPSNALTLRLDIGNLVDGRRETLRDVYDGARDAAPLLYREDRSTRRGRHAYLQVRKVL